ncbi:hypothetical protein Goshw_029356 [Gossypium schwendimanii]|uniref:Uncharacterized protein n=1 Tax=Gossypium schwendimanii TaxID=34291 RepID=A0A7J9N203_GOSSC|nr:hypothetical protein [Gossypium schwendimanii]
MEEEKMNLRLDALKKRLSENQKEKWELENKVTELEGSLHRHRNQNSVVELRASLNRIEEMKEKNRRVRSNIVELRDPDRVLGS